MVKRVICRAFVFLWIVASPFAAALAITFPLEAERENQEFMLDMVTNGYSRLWREHWDGGDNRFRFRLGSNNVRDWFLEEELKLATTLHDRVRFRFYHARLLRQSNEELSRDAFEFESRIYGNNYLSLVITPTFAKAENAVGLMLQNRREVNRYTAVFVEWPQWLRNYSERHKDTSDSLLSVFTEQPIRYGLDMRERFGDRVWLRALVELTTAFEISDEKADTGERRFFEAKEAVALSSWLEYVWHPKRTLAEQSVVGIEAAYWKQEKFDSTRMSPPVPSLGPLDMRSASQLAGGVMPSAGAMSTSFGGLPANAGVTSPFDAASPAAGGSHGGGLSRLPMEIGNDFYNRSEVSGVLAWREVRKHIAPYAWIVVNDRVTARATVYVGDREIRQRLDTGALTTIRNEYIVPAIGVRVGLDARRSSAFEVGFASEWRERKQQSNIGPEITGHFDDHRLCFAYEYAFGGARIIRIAESIDLDGEDHGQFGLHDHGFLQLIFEF
jgi:hypothetical protein